LLTFKVIVKTGLLLLWPQSRCDGHKEFRCGMCSRDKLEGACCN